MSQVMKSSYQHPELTGNHSGVRMKFWGVCCVGGKAYKQVVNYRFHLTMAVLDPKSYDREVRDRTVTLSVIQHGQVFLLCVLKHGEIQQVSLNLIFDKGDDVTFSVGGYGTVHLTGYQLIDSSDGALDMDNEHYCPVAELGSEKQIRKRLNPPVNGVETKKVTAKFMKATLRDSGDDDDDDDEEDSDFSIGDLEIGETDEDDDGDEEEEDDDDDDIDIEIDEEEIKDVLLDRDEMETPPMSEGSQKRKFGKMSPSQKRMKEDKLDMSKSERKDEVECLEVVESDSDNGDLNSSIGNTPMPKKLDDSSKAKQKNKKRKRLSEISNLDKSVKIDDLNKSLQNTLKRKEENKAKNPVVKLEGGIEYQDVVIGRGPVATNGKVVSIYYMGRLENKSIFDSRIAPKKPFSFKLGVPEVISGLDIGVRGMKVGGQRKLKIPPKMGYGSKSVDAVPPNSTLFFTIELRAVV